MEYKESLGSLMAYADRQTIDVFGKWHIQEPMLDKLFADVACTSRKKISSFVPVFAILASLHGA